MQDPDDDAPAIATTSVGRVERVLNLLAMLLGTARPMLRDEILAEVAGYPVGDVAARRAFERDKEMLRAMGVPITTTVLADGIEIGYRVVPDEYYLPDLGLDADESAALRMAVSAVSLGSDGAGRDAPAPQRALLKLGGTTTDATPPIAALPMVPVLAPLFDAYRHRAIAEFEYRGTARQVEPWALQSQHGHWYLVGRDHSRGELRTFRADRIDGEVTVGSAGAFSVPADFDPAVHLVDAPWEIGAGERMTVRIAFDKPHDIGALERLGPDAVAEPGVDGRTIISFSAVNPGAVRAFVLGFLEHAEVLSPATLRADIVAWLEALIP